jgi:predicted O-methyltransferase YrrM
MFFCHKKIIKYLYQNRSERDLEVFYQKTMRNYKFTKKWFERHIPMWDKTLDDLKKNNEKINVLELGVFEGRAAVWILDELFKNLESKLITIDTFKNIFVNYDYESTFRRNIKESGKENQVEIIKSNSFDALIKLNYEKKLIFDLIYVDGSLTACDVLADIVLSWNLLKEGGIMILDNYEWDYYEEEFNNPRIAIDSFLKTYQQQMVVIFKRFQVAVKKVAKDVSKTPRDDKTID